MRLLISQGFLGAKAPLQSGFAKDTVFLSAKAQKLKNSAKQNSWIVCLFLVCTAFAALVKQGKTYFFKSSQTSRERRFGIEILMLCANALCQNLRIRRSRILGLYAGSRFGMFFRL